MRARPRGRRTRRHRGGVRSLRGAGGRRGAVRRPPRRAPAGRVLSYQHSGGARVVEVDVREQQMPDVRELEPALREPRLQVRDPRGRAAVEERRPVLRVENVRGDDPRRLVVEVDRLEAHAAILGRRTCRACRPLALLDDLLEPGEHLLPVGLGVLGRFLRVVSVLAQRDAGLLITAPRVRTRSCGSSRARPPRRSAG